MDEEKVKTEEMTVATQETKIAPTIEGPQNIWNNQDLYKIAINQAKVLASSDLVPEGTYKGKAANCLIALDMAYRMNMSPLNVMQNLFIVKGKPGWSGQYCIAAINACGRFSPLEFIRLVDKDGNTTGYYAQATNVVTGKICESSPVTWDMVKAEGWYDKSGSKWKTMPDQMFKYRCAAFFARTFCPEVLNGLQTVEELRDVRGYDIVTLDTEAKDAKA